MFNSRLRFEPLVGLFPVHGNLIERKTDGFNSQAAMLTANDMDSILSSDAIDHLHCCTGKPCLHD
jgi:hypothetical protein